MFMHFEAMSKQDKKKEIQIFYNRKRFSYIRVTRTKKYTNIN